jgi:carbon-monoxide dehydrogenase iron sulfur subunit
LEYKLLIFDLEKCIGCGNCLTVCPTNAIVNEPTAFGHGSSEHNALKVINGKLIDKNICHQCTDAPCILACPKKILRKTEGSITVLDYDLTEEDKEKYEKVLEICATCKDTPCVEACPYNHIVIIPIFVHSKQLAVPIKCDQCKGDPECVKVCPTNALRYVSIREKSLDKRKLAEELAKSMGLPVKFIKVYT